jgi:hypothetical protein
MLRNSLILKRAQLGLNQLIADYKDITNYFN